MFIHWMKHNIAWEAVYRCVPKDELSIGQATGQMTNERVYAFIFGKVPFLGG